MSNQPITPDEFICDELQERGWSASDLALRMNIPLDELEGILRGEAHISPKIAALLAAALDIDAQFWLNLEAECGLARTQSANLLKQFRPRYCQISGRLLLAVAGILARARLRTTYFAPSLPDSA